MLTPLSECSVIVSVSQARLISKDNTPPLTLEAATSPPGERPRRGKQQQQRIKRVGTYQLDDELAPQALHVWRLLTLRNTLFDREKEKQQRRRALSGVGGGSSVRASEPNKSVGRSRCGGLKASTGDQAWSRGWRVGPEGRPTYFQCAGRAVNNPPCGRHEARTKQRSKARVRLIDGHRYECRASVGSRERRVGGQ